MVETNGVATQIQDLLFHLMVHMSYLREVEP